jgi:hypothetical protein
MANSRTKKLSLALAALLIGFVAAEIGVRAVGTRDQAGNFYFQNRLI